MQPQPQWKKLIDWFITMGFANTFSLVSLWLTPHCRKPLRLSICSWRGSDPTPCQSCWPTTRCLQVTGAGLCMFTADSMSLDVYVNFMDDSVDMKCIEITESEHS